jgi:hypothetical protein
MNAHTTVAQRASEQRAFKAANTEEQMLYQRGYEIAIWATPLLNTLQMGAEMRRHGAPENALAYFGSKPNGKIEVPTYNNTTPYIFGNATLKGGPMAIDVPAASDKAKYFGTVFNVWDSAIEDFGPGGIDDGKGGKYVLLPPGWKGDLPSSHTSLQSSSYVFQFLLRCVPARAGEQGWADAVEYAQSLKLYPLAEAASPKPTRWFDVSKINGYFRGNPYLGIDSFKLIDEYVQSEPVQECDKDMHGMLAHIGIRKGQPFAPDANTAKILDQAAKDAELYMRTELENNRVTDHYWPDRTWGTFRVGAEIVRTHGTWNFPDRLDYHARALEFYYFAVGMPRRYAGTSGATFYIFGTVDGQNRPLDGAKNYRLHVPANVPVRDFWSLILYSTRTRSYLDTEKFGLSSKDALQINADGSVDLYLSPKAPVGKESNWLATRADERILPCFRFYGPTEALANKTWKLDDFEEVK